jgi:hypothetical protein
MVAVPLVAAAAGRLLDSLLGGSGPGIAAIVGGVIGNQADSLIEDATGVVERRVLAGDLGPAKRYS